MIYPLLYKLQGFDIDGEFGRGTKKLLADTLSNSIKNFLIPKKDIVSQDSVAGYDVMIFMTLSGEIFWTKEEQERMEQAFKDDVSHYLKLKTGGLDAATTAAGYLFLSGTTCWTTEEQVRMEQALRYAIEKNLEKKWDFGAAEQAWCYLILFGKTFWNRKDHERMENALRDQIQESLNKNDPIYYPGAASAWLDYCTLRVYD